MSSVQNLNPAQQTFVAVMGTIISNAVVQPLCTLKNLMMVQQMHHLHSQSHIKLKLKILYRGYKESCLTESANYAACLVMNEWLRQQNCNSLVSSTIAGMVSTPIATIGESYIINRQIGNIINSRLLIGALQRSEILATSLREIPFSIAIFSTAPAIEKKIHSTSDFANKIIAGLIAGFAAGAITAPSDTVRALVQARTSEYPDGMHFSQAVKQLKKDLATKEGIRQMKKNSMARAWYISIAIATLHLLNEKLPKFFNQKESDEMS
jgi:hypothetical protein